jgi:hypothetical protein
MRSISPQVLTGYLPLSDRFILEENELSTGLDPPEQGLFRQDRRFGSFGLHVPYIFAKQNRIVSSCILVINPYTIP